MAMIRIFELVYYLFIKPESVHNNFFNNYKKIINDDMSSCFEF